MFRSSHALLGVCFLVCPLVAGNNMSLAEESNAELAHMVFFTLADDSEENRKTLIQACHRHLSGHQGAVYFSVGAIAEELQREVNDQSFDVALHLVFADREAHDRYQTHPRHLRFIDQNKHLWSAVRVFDSYVQPANSKDGSAAVDRFLESRVERGLKGDALFEVVNDVAAATSFADAERIRVELDGRSLQMEGITKNQRVRLSDASGKTVADLLTAIVVAANPDRRARDPASKSQMLVWVKAADGKSIKITTRRAATKQGIELPKVFRTNPQL